MKVKIKNRTDLDAHIKKLCASRDKSGNEVLASSDKTRAVVGDIQHYMYIAQTALGLFRGITNYHRSPKTRIRNVAVIAGVYFLTKFLRQKLVKQPNSDESS